VRHAALLRADLHDLAVLGQRVEDAPAFLRLVSQRLFNVNVLAGRHGVDRHRHVPVIGRGDEHGVHVFVAQELVIIAVGRRLGIGEFLRLLQVRFVDVAQRHHARVRHLGERLHQVPAAASCADQADVEPLVGAESFGRGGQGQRGRGARGG
jgi:hypothetical protein